jgi:hypothetical protein
MMNYKDCGRKRSLPNFKILLQHSPGGTEENHENLSQDSRSAGRRFAIHHATCMLAASNEL